MEGGFTSYAERIDARKVRERSRSFMDHFSQARLFYQSQSAPEKSHIIDALRFELGKVMHEEIRMRMLTILHQIDKTLAKEVGDGLGLSVPQKNMQINHSVPADASPKDYESVNKKMSLEKSAALSMENTVKDSIKTRKVAILAADGVDDKSLTTVKDAIRKEGGMCDLVSIHLGSIRTKGNQRVPIDKSFLTSASVFYDAVYIPGGEQSITTLESEAKAIHFINEAFKHCKVIGAHLSALPVLRASNFAHTIAENKNPVEDPGLIVHGDPAKLVKQFIIALTQHRVWEREQFRKVPA
jgi:catalase